MEDLKAYILHRFSFEVIHVGHPGVCVCIDTHVSMYTHLDVNLHEYHQFRIWVGFVQIGEEPMQTSI